MRKGLNKKGFSLVELMIVVVIMGILVAVAIPLYGAVTDNAREKTCKNNQRDVRAMFAKYILSDQNNSAQTLFKNGATTFDGSSGESETDVFDEEFLASFDGGRLPTCPEDNHYYRITIVSPTEIKVECMASGSVDDEHSAE